MWKDILAWAMGWPKGVLNISSKLSPEHAASTAVTRKPNIQQPPIDASIPMGTALVGFLASSLIWTQESNAPIVQIGDSQESIKVHPDGHAVSFIAWLKTYFAELIGILRTRMLTGNAMIVTRIKAKLAMTNQV